MSNIDPSRQQFDAFKNLPRDTPIMMLNLVAFNQQAQYKQGQSDADTQLSGEQAYARYSAASAAIFEDVGGTIIWRGKPETVVIGPEAEQWDVAFIAKYPNANAFLAMVTNPDYQAIVFHRQAAVKDSRLIRMSETEAGDSF